MIAEILFLLITLAFVLWLNKHYRDQCKRCDLEAVKKSATKKPSGATTSNKSTPIVNCPRGCDIVYMGRYGRCIKCGYNWEK